MTPTRKSEREIERDTGPVAEQPSPKWKPKRQEVMIMLTLAILSLMVSLDATVIVTSLAVRAEPEPFIVLMHSDTCSRRLCKL